MAFNREQRHAKRGGSMSYLTSTLIPGEKIVYQTRLHWIVMLANLVTALALFALGGLLLWYVSTHSGLEAATVFGMNLTGAVLLGCGLIALLAGAVRRNATEMAVTNRRVVVKKGLVRRTTIEMLLNKVESIEVRETTWGRLLGYGTIVVVGSGGSTEPFSQIAHPLAFRSQLQQQIERTPRLIEERVTAAQAAAPSAPRIPEASKLDA
jgi:uncharacterized membrane protein YdbT with pleckstrin-like domain